MSKWIFLFSLMMLSPSEGIGQMTTDAHDNLVTMSHVTVAGDVVSDPFSGDNDGDSSAIASAVRVAHQPAKADTFVVFAPSLLPRYQAGPQIRAPPYLLFV